MKVTQQKGNENRRDGRGNGVAPVKDEKNGAGTDAEREKESISGWRSKTEFTWGSTPSQRLILGYEVHREV